MLRALHGAALFLAGCSLAVSTDGLAGGEGSRLEDDRDAAGPAKNDASVTTVQVDASEGGPITIDTTSRYARAVLRDEPALYLRFGEAKGTTAVKNELGAYAASYPPAGVELGVTGALAGDPDTAISFSGGLIELPEGHACAGTAPCAVELWMRIEKIQDGYGWVLDHQTWDPRQGWMFQTSGGYIAVERWAGGDGVGAAFNQVAISFGDWHHVVAVWDEGGLRLYYDGEIREAHTILNPIPETKGKWTVGGTACFGCSNRSYYQGALDELAVYEHSLGAEQVKAHFAAAQAP